MLKVLELFSGYGGASFAFKKLNIEHEIIGFSDIDKSANYIYKVNHKIPIKYQDQVIFKVPKQLNDITKINPETLPNFDLLTAGFPCQSFSIVGKREGFLAVNKGKLFFEIIRIAQVKKPRYMLLENVEGLLSHDKGRTFRIILFELKRIGYKVKWKVLKSKDYGIPQYRPRVWFTCFRERSDYNTFMFPEKQKLKLKLIDLLDKNVDKKYYLNQQDKQKILNRINNNNNNFGNNPLNVFGVSQTLIAHSGKDKTDIPYFEVFDIRLDDEIRKRKGNITPILCSSQTGKTIFNKPILNINNVYRRFTPREVFRLQGFLNDEIDFGKLSDNKLYFLAGNGWDINLASKILEQMFKGNQNEQKFLNDFKP